MPKSKKLTYDTIVDPVAHRQHQSALFLSHGQIGPHVLRVSVCIDPYYASQCNASVARWDGNQWHIMSDWHTGYSLFAYMNTDARRAISDFVHGTSKTLPLSLFTPDTVELLRLARAVLKV